MVTRHSLFAVLLGLAHLAEMAAAGWGMGMGAQKELIQGVCYTPQATPLEGDEAPKLPQDDFMTEAAMPLWGPHGRGDLLTIKALGANHVRMYGNSPTDDHTSFLDYANKIGLKVIAGLSNSPYNQMEGNCNSTGLNCFDVIKDAYKQNLLNGFLVDLDSGAPRYHSSLSHLIVINEPEIQLGHPNKTHAEFTDPKGWLKGVLSGIDGVLEAEKEMNITGDLIGLTVTLTYSICELCATQVPGLGNMLELKQALLNPSSYGYTPKNNLGDVFKSRFLNSMNTGEPFEHITQAGVQFLQRYEAAFPDTAFMFEEYHSFYQWGYQATLKDLNDVLNYARNSPTLLGINFFEFQISWPKMSEKFEELFFGMFGVGDYTVTKMNYFGVWVPVNCLTEVYWDLYPGGHPEKADDPSCKLNGCKFAPSSNMTGAVTAAYGGEGIKFGSLCTPNPEKVPLTAEGYKEVKSLGNCKTAMMTFVTRLVEHLGGRCEDNAGFISFCEKYCMGSGTLVPDTTDSNARLLAAATPEAEFDEMVTLLRLRPGWAWWSMYAACVADRKSNVYMIEGTADELCMKKMKYFNCRNVPLRCKQDPWHFADYVFSTYYNELQGSKDGLIALSTTAPNPLEDCNFNGTGIFGHTVSMYKDGMDANCVVTQDPAGTPLDNQGYAAVRRVGDPKANAVFIKRYLQKRDNESVCDQEELKKLSEEPPPSLYQLNGRTQGQWWICGGYTGNDCDSCEKLEEGGLGNLLKNPWFAAPVIIMTIVLCVTCCVTCWYARNQPEESEEWAKKHFAKKGYRLDNNNNRGSQRTSRSVDLAPPVQETPRMYPASASQPFSSTLYPGSARYILQSRTAVAPEMARTARVVRQS